MTEIEVYRGDITTLEIDAIVNAANSSLLGGGGVDGAIHKAAGCALYEECRNLPAGKGGRCPPGEARITGAYQLPCRRVIHTVGPVYGTGGEAAVLEACYRNCLALAAENDLASIAFPGISTGVYGYPKKEAAEIAVQTVRETVPKYPVIKKVVFVCFDAESFDLYTALLADG